jgi:hypothetical protein
VDEVDETEQALIICRKCESQLMTMKSPPDPMARCPLYNGDSDQKMIDCWLSIHKDD